MAAKKTVKKSTGKAAANKSKKSPILLIVAGVVMVLLVFAFLLKAQNSGKSAPDTNKGNVFTSIKDALSKSVSLECTYTDGQGKETVAYIKNGAIRSDFTGENSGSVIMKDKMMYIWDTDKKQGMKMSYADEDVDSEGSESDEVMSQEQGNPSDVVSELEQYKDNCKSAVVSDSLFTPPSDIEFTDFSQMMENPESFMQYSN